MTRIHLPADLPALFAFLVRLVRRLEHTLQRRLAPRHRLLFGVGFVF